MDVSIIIVNYQTPKLVIDCVRSIQEKTVGITYEIILVDNGSKDGSADLLREALQKDVTLVVSSVNLGFGKANNLGVGYASGKYIFLLNSDTLLLNNAVGILHDYLETHRQAGVAGGNLYTKEYTPSPSFCTRFDDLESVKKEAAWSRILGTSLRKRYVQWFCSPEQKEKFYYKESFNFGEGVKRVAYIFGTDMMLSKALYEKMGGFDPDFFMYAEEEELSFRIMQAGYEIVNVPGAKLIHYDAASTEKEKDQNSRRYILRQKGAFLYYEKRFGPKGPQTYYQYKLLGLERRLKLGRVLGRKSLAEAAGSRKRYLAEAYEQFLKEQDAKGVGEDG